MLGAIIGDIIGSRFEWHNIKTKEFELFSYKSRPTDDSIMTLALAKAILDSKDDYSDLGDLAVDSMQTWDGNIRTAAMAAALNTGYSPSIPNPTKAWETALPCVSARQDMRPKIWQKPNYCPRKSLKSPMTIPKD